MLQVKCKRNKRVYTGASDGQVLDLLSHLCLQPETVRVLQLVRATEDGMVKLCCGEHIYS